MIRKGSSILHSIGTFENKTSVKMGAPCPNTIHFFICKESSLYLSGRCVMPLGTSCKFVFHVPRKLKSQLLAEERHAE